MIDSLSESSSGAAPAPRIPATQPAAPAQQSLLNSRPLSDIRELSEPSLAENRHIEFWPRPHQDARIPHNLFRTEYECLDHDQSKPTTHQAPMFKLAEKAAFSDEVMVASSNYSSTTPERSEQFVIPRSAVPRRSLSQRHARERNYEYVTKHSVGVTNGSPAQRLKGPSYTIPNRGHARSPVKEARSASSLVRSENRRTVPQTYIRSPPPIDILDSSTHKHPRLKLLLHVSASLFVGGGSVEGDVRLIADNNERLKFQRCLDLYSVSVDLIGFESLGTGRKSVFLALGTDLIDANHPPPTSMMAVPVQQPAQNASWPLAPSRTSLPFMISLPLDTGPPPFQSKHASIRFILSVTALLHDASKLYQVRTLQDVSVLPTYDPERALVLLSSPLTATDASSTPHSNNEDIIELTAGLHRQVWVSGSSIFVDLRIENRCQKPVRKIELTLVRNILCYKHAAATSSGAPVDHARLFEANERTVVARSTSKASSAGWQGVEPRTTDVRTWQLAIPRDNATVRCGKFFEVRYFLGVTAWISSSKLASVQLPVVLIHMNSLDVVPNSVAQVAAAIEETRAQKRPERQTSRTKIRLHARQRSVSSPARVSNLTRQESFSQGRAFMAPRQQSLDQRRDERANIEELRNILDSSPRKQHRQPHLAGVIGRVTSSASARTQRANQIDWFASPEDELLSTHPRTDTDTYKQTGMEGRPAGQANEISAPLWDRIRRMRSLDSMRSKQSLTPGEERGRAHALLPGLGLTPQADVDTRNKGPDGARPSTSLSFRDRIDRSRFEFKAVRRKASAGWMEKPAWQWWPARKANRNAKDGWI